MSEIRRLGRTESVRIGQDDAPDLMDVEDAPSVFEPRKALLHAWTAAPEPRARTPAEEREWQVTKAYLAELQENLWTQIEAERNGTWAGPKKYKASPEARARANVRKRLSKVKKTLLESCRDLEGSLVRWRGGAPWYEAISQFERGRDAGLTVIDSLCRIVGDARQGCAVSEDWLDTHSAVLAQLDALMHEQVPAANAKQ